MPKPDELIQLEKEVTESSSQLQEDLDTSSPTLKVLLDPERARVQKLTELLQKDSDSFMEFLELSHGIGDLSEGLNAMPDHVHFSPGVEVGSILLQSILGVLGFFKSVSQFLDGEKISLSRTAKMIYAFGSIILMLLSFAFPPLALIFGAIIASVGFVMSAHSFGSTLYSIVKGYELSERCNKQLDLIFAEMQQDMDALDALDEKLNTVSSATDLTNLLHDKMQLLHVLEEKRESRNTLFKEMTQLKQLLESKNTKLNRIGLYRSVSVFLASIALAAAIVSFIVPPVGAILMIISFTLGTAWLMFSLGIFAKHLWQQRQAELAKTTVAQADTLSSNSPSNNLTAKKALEPQSVEEAVRIEIKTHDPSVMLRDHPPPESSSPHEPTLAPPPTLAKNGTDPRDTANPDPKPKDTTRVSVTEAEEEGEKEGEGEGSKPEPPSPH